MRAFAGLPRRVDKYPIRLGFSPLQGAGQQCGDSLRGVRDAGNCPGAVGGTQEARRKNDGDSIFTILLRNEEFKMKGKNALSRRQFCSSGFDDSAYEFNYQPGEFTGTIDCKRWGKGKKLVTYMTFEDGRKIAVLT